MLSKSDTPIESVAAEFAKFGIEAGYFVPTDTGMSKSIVDAHEGLRRFLQSKSVHIYRNQKQGPDHKKTVVAQLVLPHSTVERELSLYRPQSKQGDPRLWISRLNEYAKPFNLIAIIVDDGGKLHAVNCSNAEIWSSRHTPGSPLHQILTKAPRSDVADELLEELRRIAAMGFIESMRSGPTGVGFTLESMLGISANSSKAPDYRGIEIKSGRVARHGQNRTKSDLFSKVPNWRLSHLKSGKEILENHGYFSESEQRIQLYCTVKNTPNPQGLMIRIDSAGELVENVVVNKHGEESPVVVWVLEELERELASKHRETFWVKAQRRISNEKEFFQYASVVHTRRPLISNFGLLVDSGKITLDYTLNTRPNGSARDHGYKFRIWSNDFDLLFPPPLNYALSA